MAPGEREASYPRDQPWIEHAIDSGDISMNWQTVLDNPYLKDLPFKVETNRWGKIVMSPASNEHGKTQFAIGSRIQQAKKSGTVIMECSVETSDGVKVADVAWISDEFLARHGFETPYKVAPEICGDIVSPANSPAEMEEKTQLYLARGAREVWVAGEDGSVSYYAHSGRLEASAEVNDRR
jgi:Uma2 family endonuclease